MIYFLLVNWTLIGMWLLWDKMDDYSTTLVEKLAGILMVTVFGTIIFLVLMVFEVIHFSTRSWKS